MRVDPALTAAFSVTPPAKPVLCSCSISNNTCVAAPTGFTCACSGTASTGCTPVQNNLGSIQGMCTANLSSAKTYPAVTVTSGATQNEAVIFVSHGAHGYGSFVAGASNAGCNGTRLLFPSLGGRACTAQMFTCTSTAGLGAAECNASGTAQFIDALQTANGSATYDDMLLYADRNALVAMAGSGSACQTVW